LGKLLMGEKTSIAKDISQQTAPKKSTHHQFPLLLDLPIACQGFPHTNYLPIPIQIKIPALPMSESPWQPFGV
jgi:hypothetical protein